MLFTQTFYEIISRRHDSGNFDASDGTGGANGSIRFDLEQSHGGNAGLVTALKLLNPIKKKFPDVGYADLFQMASAAAIEVSGGPKIDMKYGRVDAEDESCVPVDGRLPSAGPPYQEATGSDPAKESSDQVPNPRKYISHTLQTPKSLQNLLISLICSYEVPRPSYDP
jgi:hypothetical protein